MEKWRIPELGREGTDVPHAMAERKEGLKKKRGVMIKGHMIQLEGGAHWKNLGQFEDLNKYSNRWCEQCKNKANE